MSTGAGVGEGGLGEGGLGGGALGGGGGGLGGGGPREGGLGQGGLGAPALGAARRPGGSAWIWSPALDLGVFALPALVAFALAAALQGATAGALPEWAWLCFVLGVDVAHVWSTIFRTYLDPAELRRRPLRYALVPLACWAAGALLHARSPALFWRVLAYAALLHFVRQQLGWAAVYRARARTTGRADRLIDELALYAATGVPVFLWHVSLPRPFAWFLQGDFVDLAPLAPLAPFAQGLLVAALAAFALHHARRARQGAPIAAGKIALVASTAVAWYGGIVADDDLTFTLTNVLPHGVPYVALLWAYARAGRRRAPGTPAARVVALGFGAFVGALLLLAFVEEMAWDALVWHDRPWLFGAWPAFELGGWAHALVPLLALPQATHYALDALLWRRGEANAAQAEALGFGRAPD
ncbi:MAG TPA: hypothetical protein VFS00_21930 [Polyangiaceae bacterium]|nr:hypothetical protein [Polyangiaceae bacterium]